MNGRSTTRRGRPPRDVDVNLVPEAKGYEFIKAYDGGDALVHHSEIGF
jgi:hypothetical protein